MFHQNVIFSNIGGMTGKAACLFHEVLVTTDKFSVIFYQASLGAKVSTATDSAVCI
jgi:hypothetical protein